MRKVIILLLILMIPLVYARSIDVNLKINESYYRDGVNITLMNIDKNKEKFIICVNGNKYIVSEKGISRDIFTIKVDDINKDNVDLEVDIDNKYCDNCKCEGYCNNKRCFPNPKYIPKVKQKKEVENKEVIRENISVGYYAVFVFIVLFAIIIITSYYIIKKKF